MTPSFSFDEYIKILKKFKPLFCDYREVENLEKFALLRHDVEFSVLRALDIAKLDNQIGVSSSFLFQVKSDAYNISSVKNNKCIKEIINLGHNVGLHFYVSHIKENDWDHLHQELLDQRRVFEVATKIKLDRFSFHRPPGWVLENRTDAIDGLINMYGPSFFEFKSKPTEIKYLADSKHRFSYGHPLDDLNFQKYQILLHPDEWTEQGFPEDKNFTSLIDENYDNFLSMLNSETKNFFKYYKL